MSGLSKPGPETADLTALLNADVRPEDLSRRLLDVHLHDIAARDPESAELATALALARSFDAEIVGVLRGDPDPPRDEALLESLSEFSLVLSRVEGSYAYHDTLRHQLLQEWHTEAPDEAAELNRRLVDHYTARLAEAETLRRDLEEVGDLIAEAAPARHRALIAAIRARTLTVLREAQYHCISVSSETGYAFLTAQCEKLESAGRVLLCAELLRAAREDVEHLAVPDDGRLLRLIRYWEARIASDRGRADEALAIATELEADLGDTDDKLRLWTLSLLAGVHRARGDGREARAALERAVALVEAADPDPFNTPVVYAQIGDLQSLSLELGPARASRLRAAESASKVRHVAIEVSSHLELAQLSVQAGERRRAVTEAFTAVDLARSAGLRDPHTNAALLVPLMTILGRESPWQLPTLHAERAALLPRADEEADDDPAPVDVALEADYIEALRAAGLLTLAGELLDWVEATFAGGADGSRSTTLSYASGRVRDEQGRLAEAAQAYGRLADAPTTQPWDRAAGLSNRAMVDLRLSPSAAERELAEAVALWQEMGQDRYVLLARVLRARALVLLERVEDAARELAAIEPVPEELPPWLQAELSETRAAVLRASGDWSATADAEAAAAALYDRIGESRERVLALWRSAAALGAAARFEPASERAAGAAAAWRELAFRDRALADRPPAMADADEHNAAGARAVHRAANDDGLHRGRALFRAATEKVPGDPWYNLNLAYTCAALADWTEAQRAMERVIAQGAPWNDEVLVARCEQFDRQRERSSHEEPVEDRGATRFLRTVVRRAIGTR